MMDWTDGYVQELDYTHSHHAALAPGLMDLACASRGVVSPLDGRPLKYLELAFGQGVSLNIHAAAFPGEYWGIDFNPVHAANARELASASGAGARIIDASLEEFAARDDLPEFDVIAMHGTWSWISARNRHFVVEILRRRLAPGGLAYLSYNCWPGWAAEMPLRHLLAEHVAKSGSGGTLSARIDRALEFARAMADANALFFKAYPKLKDVLAQMAAQNRHYVAHEYFNLDWHPMPSAEVAEALSAAKLVFAASATLADHLDTENSFPSAGALLAGVSDPALRETARDYLTNRRFRRDIFVKGLRTVAPAQRHARLRGMAFSLLQHPDHVPSKITVAAGEATLHPEIYRPFIESMASDGYAPKTLEQAAKHPKCAKLTPAQVAQAAVMLVGAGSLHPVQPSSAVEIAAPRCKALNALILERATRSDNVSALASPVTGAGVFAVRQEMLFLRALARGQMTPDLWAAHAWDCLKANDERLLQDGKALEGEAEHLTRLRSGAEAFARVRLPVLKALRVA